MGNNSIITPKAGQRQIDTTGLHLISQPPTMANKNGVQREPGKIPSENNMDSPTNQLTEDNNQPRQPNQ
jgi:hypothetical protein